MNLVQVLINAVTILISLAALVVSGAIAYRQTDVMRQANNVTLTLQLVDQEFRRGEFVENESFILQSLRATCPPCAFRELPQEARVAVSHVVYLYQWLGTMIAFRLIDERFVLASFSYRIRLIWPALEPYIRLEREARGDSFLSFFEDLVVRSNRTRQTEIHQKLGLKRMPVVAHDQASGPVTPSKGGQP